MTELRFTLPWPPSVNRYFAVMNRGPLAGRILISSDAKKYRQAVRASLFSQGIKAARLDCSIQIDIVAYPPTRHAIDLDNRLKPVLDSLKTRTDRYRAEGRVLKQVIPGIFEDDSLVDDLRIRRGPIVSGGRLDVVIKQLSAESAKQEPLLV